mgnify:CR=1 FL=1
MNYFTLNTNEMKREIVNYSNYLTKDIALKSEKDFLRDMFYGISASNSLMLSDISRKLQEKIKLDNTIERLSIHLANDIEGKRRIEQNYYEFVRGMIPDNPIVNFDNTDITKQYGKKFEYLDTVIDASDPKKEKKPGYPVVNAVVLGKNKKQPIPIYSKIVSTKDPKFKSMNTYTIESIDKAYEAVGKFIGVFDRGYDDKKIFRYMDKLGLEFVIRLKTNRNFLFKGKEKNILKQANSRKGKILFTAKFQGEEKQLTISYTRVEMVDGAHEEYTCVFVYGLGEEPMMLLTNKQVKSAHDVRVILRMYLDRWKIEEVHRAEKQSYEYENMRVRTLKGMNNLNFIFMMLLGLITKLIEEMDKRLLSIKIMEQSQSLRENLVVFISMFARGIKEILSYAQIGVNSFKEKKKQKEECTYIEQLSLQL